jgi:hypothetical protein
VVVSARRVDGAIEVRVTDDGPGIPAASIDRIFELFYRDPTSSRLVAGSGIGLFVCASLAEAMGGRIWARRPEGGGTEVGFTLRVIEADVEEPAVPAAPLGRAEVIHVTPPPGNGEAAGTMAPGPTPSLSGGDG